MWDSNAQQWGINPQARDKTTTMGNILYINAWNALCNYDMYPNSKEPH
jgi:hypothetical protein